MPSLAQVCETDGLVRWRLIQVQRGGPLIECGTWSEDAPSVTEIERTADEWGAGQYRLLSYYAKSRPGPTSMWKVAERVDHDPEKASERAAVRALVDTVSHLRDMHKDSVRSWEALAKEQLKTTAKLQGQIAVLRESAAGQATPTAQAIDSLTEVLVERPELLTAAGQGIGSIVRGAAGMLKPAPSTADPEEST